MRPNMPYDCREKDNVNAWKKLPPTMQHFIRTVQNNIQEEIEKKNPGKFRPTSGFRAEAVNRKVSGALESLHRLGMARDFVSVDGKSIDAYVPFFDSKRFGCLRSAHCWHVYLIV